MSGATQLRCGQMFVAGLASLCSGLISNRSKDFCRTAEVKCAIIWEYLFSLLSVQGRNHGSKVEGDHHGERGSASLIWGSGALPPVGSRGKALGGG
jgi:hypothetical protein